MQYTVEDAKSRFAQLLAAALSGEDVVIAVDAASAVRLAPVAHSGFKLGVLEGKVGLPPDFLEPMQPEELAGWEGSHGSSPA